MHALVAGAMVPVYGLIHTHLDDHVSAVSRAGLISSKYRCGSEALDE